MRLAGPVLLIIIKLVCNQAQAETVNTHEHQGLLQPYIDEPPVVELEQADITVLESGNPLFKQIKLQDARRGIAIFRVNADTATVWSVINDFNSYPKWIDSLEKTEIYKQYNGQVYVKFTASSWPSGTSTWYAVHDYPVTDRQWGTWRLDYDYRSDLDDSVGFWRVMPVAGTQQSDVIYSADLKLRGFFSFLFESTLIEGSLKDATQWVKTQAEARSNAARQH